MLQKKKSSLLEKDFNVLIIWDDIGFMWKITFGVFIKFLRFETPELQ